VVSKQIDSFSVFLETVDRGVRAAKLADLVDTPPLGTLSAPARAVLSRVLAEPDGSVPSERLRAEFGLGVLEFADAVSDLVDHGLVAVMGTGASEALALSSNGRQH
jgi:hypothetical protein